MIPSKAVILLPQIAIIEIGGDGGVGEVFHYPRITLTSELVSRAPGIGCSIVPLIQLSTVPLAQMATANITVAATV